MAEALVSLVLEKLTSSALEQSASYIQSKVTLVVGTHEEISKLIAKLEMVQAVLVDADEKQVKNNAVRLWLDNLKQVVYDADDVLDEWHTRAAISQFQGDDVVAGTRKKVLSYLLSPCFCFEDVIVRYDISHKIRDINRRLDEIVNQRIDFDLRVVKVHQNQNEPQQFISSIVDVSKIHGRDQAKEEMMSRLLCERSFHGTPLGIFAIVGIGGLGKTTLAKLIYSERRVAEIFKTKMWVVVSEPFNLVEVAKAIIQEAGMVVPNSSVWEEVHKCLCESVKGKQFLLVLDDVWTEDPNHWEQLKLAFDGGALGSRIIVTTRNRGVAIRMGCVDQAILVLGELSIDDSWSVIKDIALMGREEEAQERFERVGREIAAKCKGVPLAIKILASLLSERQTREEWNDVLASDLWELPDIQRDFLPSLFLSYYSLPPISKQCFQYCAMLPKDFLIRRDYLLNLWTSQGFFGFNERSSKTHFHNLAMRSFFQDFVKDSDGNITSCKMHDLVHDFAMHLWQSEGSILKAGDTNFDGEKIRHLAASDCDIPSILKGRKLRTLVWHGGPEIPIDLFNILTCLRTLILSNSNMVVVPDKVEKLVHLRHLDLSDTRLGELPETICSLYNLQVLALNRCWKLHKLPEKIGKLSNLRQLEIEHTYSLSYFPKSIAKLSLLRSLCKFIVSDAGDGCMTGDLQFLNCLHGALELNGLSRVTDEKDAIRAELGMKKHLRNLVFNFGGESGVSVRMKYVLEKLEPHQNLETIEISDYPDLQFPGWVQNYSVLANIVEMRLIRCNECTELPALGKLVSLKTLVISGMRSVTCIGQEFYGFDAHQ